MSSNKNGPQPLTVEEFTDFMQPVIEALGKFDSLEAGQKRLEAGQKRLEKRVGHLEEDMEVVKGDLRTVKRDLSEVKKNTDMQYVDVKSNTKRIERLEKVVFN